MRQFLLVQLIRGYPAESCIARDVGLEGVFDLITEFTEIRERDMDRTLYWGGSGWVFFLLCLTIDHEINNNAFFGKY